MLSHWIEPSQKVVSAAAVYQKSPRTSEMSIRAHAHAHAPRYYISLDWSSGSRSVNSFTLVLYGLVSTK